MSEFKVSNDEAAVVTAPQVVNIPHSAAGWIGPGQSVLLIFGSGLAGVALQYQ